MKTTLAGQTKGSVANTGGGGGGGGGHRQPVVFSLIITALHCLAHCVLHQLLCKTKYHKTEDQLELVNTRHRQALFAQLQFQKSLIFFIFSFPHSLPLLLSLF